jgi:hypothetical protein
MDQMGQKGGNLSMTVITDPLVKASNPTYGYMTVRAEMLRRLKQPATDLYVQYEPDNALVLYHRAGAPIESDQVCKLLDGGIQQIYVRTDDFHAFGAQLLESVESYGNQEPVPVAAHRLRTVRRGGGKGGA